MAQAVQHFLDAACGFACGFTGDHDAVILFVASDQFAVAILNKPTRRRDKPHVDAVFFGKQAKLIGLFHAKIAHPPAKHGHHRGHAAAHEQRPPCDVLGRAFDIARGPSHIALHPPPVSINFTHRGFVQIKQIPRQTDNRRIAHDRP